MNQRKPILHGRDHLPNGADPIPGIGDPPEFIEYNISASLYRTETFDVTEVASDMAYPVPFDKLLWNVDTPYGGMWDPDDFPTRLTCTLAGTYVITGGLEWNTLTLVGAGGLGNTSLAVRMNGDTYLAINQHYGPGVEPWTMFIATVHQLAVDDYVELICGQHTGNPVGINTTSLYSPRLTLARMVGTMIVPPSGQA